jgi:hypothetical protein
VWKNVSCVTVKGTESNSNLSQNMGKGKYPRIRKNQQNENREFLVTVVNVVIIVRYRVKWAGRKKVEPGI